MIEEWKDIAGYEGKYQVSSLGRIKSLAREVDRKCKGVRVIPETILNQNSPKLGYQQVCLFSNSKRAFPLVHRLVAQAFLVNEHNKPQVNHKNGVREDNRIENLEWVSGSENQIHAYSTGLQSHQYGSKRYCSKLNESQVVKIKHDILNNKTLRSIAKEYNVNPVTISNIKNNKTWVRVLI